MTKNPYNLTFGKEPVNAISRDKQINEIVDGFTADNPEFQVCMITGVRGSGKTVMMTEVSNELKKSFKLECIMQELIIYFLNI